MLPPDKPLFFDPVPDEAPPGLELPDDPPGLEPPDDPPGRVLPEDPPGRELPGTFPEPTGPVPSSEPLRYTFPLPLPFLVSLLLGVLSIF